MPNYYCTSWYFQMKSKLNDASVKGTLTQEFCNLPGPLIHSIKPFRRDIYWLCDVAHSRDLTPQGGLPLNFWLPGVGYPLKLNSPVWVNPLGLTLWNELPLKIWLPGGVCSGQEDRNCWCHHSNIMWAEVVGKGWVGSESKGWAVPTRQGTRVDGDSPPWARHQPSK